MQKRTLLAAVWLAFSLKTAAQTAPCTALPQATETMHTNRLRMPHLRPGAYIGGYPMYNPSAVTADYDGLPQPTAGLFASSIWVGGLDEAGQVRVSATTFPKDNDFHFVAGPFGLSASECGRWDRFWSVNRTALAAHRTDVADGNLDDPLPEILAWPGRGNPHFAAQNGFDLPNAADDFAPFFDADGDGMYDPFAGDFPHPNGVDTAIVPGKIIWNLFSDPQPGVFVSPDLPGMGGFEYQWTAWATACADTSDVLNDAVFFSLRLTNRTGERRDSVVLGLFADEELGFDFDDCMGTNAPLNSLYWYNRSNHDTLVGNFAMPVFGKNPPTAALTYLNISLHRSIGFHGSGLCLPNHTTDFPLFTEDFWNYLNGRWKTGKPLTFGGSGYTTNPQAINTPFIFPDDPNQPDGWSELDSSPSSCGDFSVGSAFVGDMHPNASKTIDYAFSYHRGPGLDHLQNVGYLFQRVADLRQRYAQNFAADCAPEPLCQADDCVWPGDANRDGIVNHCDILPIGVALGKTGLPRPSFTTWEGKTAPDWGQLFNQTYDLKHTDANGDGSVGLPDAGVVRDFYGLKKPDYQAVDVYPAGTDVAIESSLINPDNVQTGDVAYLRVVSAVPDGLRGLAMTLEWDTVYWEIYMLPQLSPFSFHHANLACRVYTKGKFESSFFKFDPFTGSSFPIIVLSLRARTLPPGTPPLTYIRLKNIKGIRADGSEISLGSWPRQFCFGGGCTVGTDEGIENQAVRVFPNPARHAIHIETDGAPVLWLALLDAAGRTVRAPFLDENSPAAICPTDGLPGGLYFLKVKTRDGLAVRKVVVE